MMLFPQYLLPISILFKVFFVIDIYIETMSNCMNYNFTDQEVKSVNINIETYDGVVYLMGIARSSDELRQIAEHASVVNGVREVVSYIQIREPNSASPNREQNSGNNDRYDPDSGLLGGPSS